MIGQMPITLANKGNKQMTRNQFYAICTEATISPYLALEDGAVKNILREAKATNEDKKNIEKLKTYLQENY